ncbi:potassium transporter TrkA [Natronosalvus caseinilyticus]|uniref:potassium transporter TrkA n=1 Tax=Natronosalvus caseinilyticus TaxID=2953747 RepID=UPI0028AFBC36|nr:potassium transporter TrkA [Natronosalvus caseinilyticus]
MIDATLTNGGLLVGGIDLVTTGTSELVLDAVVRILGFVVLSGAIGAAVAFVYRWYSGDGIPDGVAVLSGLVAVALWLNTQTALQSAILGNADVLDPETAIFTVASFVVSAIAADVGRRTGDGLAADVGTVATARTIDDVSQLVRSAGRVITIDLPDEIEDAEGYDPVDDETKATVAGQTLLFPRGLTVATLRDRLVDRLEADYGIGYVDLEVSQDGTVDHLAVGSVPSGIGPTLAPGSVAVAVRADPAPDASPGDVVEVWSADGPDSRRVATADLRATAGDVVTLAIGEDDAASLDPGLEFRLVTRPSTADASRGLRALLRTADTTVATVSVEADGPLVDARVDVLPGLPLVLESSKGGRAGTTTVPALVPFPDGDRYLEAGDTCYIMGRPDELAQARFRERVPEQEREQERER